MCSKIHYIYLYIPSVNKKSFNREIKSSYFGEFFVHNIPKDGVASLRDVKHPNCKHNLSLNLSMSVAHKSKGQ